MSSPLSNRTRVPFRRRGALSVALAGAVLLAIVGSITGVIPTALSAASAATEPERPSPSPSLIPSPGPTPNPADFDVTSAREGYYPSGIVAISGEKSAGAVVTVTRQSDGFVVCTIDDSETTWACSTTLPVGETSFSASQAGSPAIVVTARSALPAPAWDSNGPLLTTGIVTGTGFPGAAIVLGGDFANQCTVVQGNGYWSCPIPTPTSGVFQVRVAQAWAGRLSEISPMSSARTVTVDKDKPAAPAITSPTAGATVTAQPVTFSGTGEEGALVSVYVDNALVCNAPVTGGQWTCAAGGLAAGPHTVKSLQQDAAGNYSGAGAEVAFSVAEAAAAPPPGTLPPSPSATPSPAPTAAPAPAPDPTPSPSTEPSPTPTPSSPFFPPPVGGDSGLPPYQTWGTPTQYGAAIPSVTRSVTDNLWLGGALLAIGFIALLALPLRLLTITLRDRVPLRVARLAGRNRETRSSDDDTPLLNPWVTAAGALVAAALLAALAGGIQAEVRYLRLIVAIGIALTLLNGVAIALAAALGSRIESLRSRFRLVPTFLAIAGVSALLSRFGGIQPPVIIGVVIAAVLAAELSVRSRGLIGLAQLVLVLMLGVGGWLGHSAMGPVVGFWASLGSETLAALTISALGSFALLILPIGRLPGATLFEWSVPAWAAVALVGVTLGGTIIASGAGFPAFIVLGIAALFAVISVTIWSWLRYIQPQLITPQPATDARG